MDTVYMVWVDLGAEWAVYLHKRHGQGKNARRKLLQVVHFEKPPGHASTPDLLRALALAWDDRFGSHPS